MATIEERTKEAGIVSQYKSDYRYDIKSVEFGYMQGTIEQREIDIMRVRQFLEREVAYNGSMTCIDNLLIEELCKAIEE